MYSDLYSLLDTVSSTGSSFNPETSWTICTIIISALGAAGLFTFFTYLKKGAEKRNFGEDIKNFFLFKGNWAEDLAKLSFYYISINYIMDALKSLTTYGDPWTFFELMFYLVFIRFVYEAALTIIRFCKSNTK